MLGLYTKGKEMINAEESKEVTIEMLKERIIKKENLIKFTEMEIGELKRTVLKLENIE